MHRVGQIPVATVTDDLLDEVELRERSICEFCFQVPVASLLVLTPGIAGSCCLPDSATGRAYYEKQYQVTFFAHER